VSLAEHARYLELRLAGFVPASLHRHQIEAYSVALEAARAAESDGEYMAATNNLLELSRSEWVDRYEAAARFYQSIGDDTRATIATDNIEAAARASNHSELISAMVGAKLASAAKRRGAEGASAQISTLVFALVAYRLEQGAAAKDELRRELGDVWTQLRTDDADFSAQSLAQPPYRSRLPFGGSGVRALIGWIDEIALEEPAIERPAPAALPAIEIPEPGEPPSAEAIAAGYRAAAAGLDPANSELAGLRAAYAEIDKLAAAAPSGRALLAEMASADLFTTIAREPMLAEARTARSELAERDGNAAAIAHCDRLIAQLTSAHSIAELELVALAAESYLAVETTWSRLLYAMALAPAVAALSYAAERADWRGVRLREAEAMSVALFGAGTETLLAVPAIWSVFEAEVFERGQTLPTSAPEGDPTIRLGEITLPTSGVAQAAAMQHVIEQMNDRPQDYASLITERQFETATAMRAHILAAIADVATPHEGALEPLAMWGQLVDFADLATATIEPPRPPNPL